MTQIPDLAFTVPGKPVPKGRPRFNRRTGRAYTPATSKAYERRVASAAWRALDGRWPDRSLCLRERPRPRGTRSPACDCDWCGAEYRLELTIVLPDRRTRDLDNVEKAVLDGLTGVLWRDDRRAYVERKRREYDPARPRVEVRVRHERDED